MSKQAKAIYKKTKAQWQGLWQNVHPSVQEALLESAVLTNLLMQDDSLSAERRLARTEELWTEVRALHHNDGC